MSHIGKGYDINQTFVIESANGEAPIFSACTGVYTNEIISCTGDTYIELGSSVIRFIGNASVTNSMSATTYYGDGSNLTGISIQDVFVTGGTYNTSNGIATFTNNTGGTFTVNGFSTSTGASFTGGTITGATQFTGGLSANTFSATTYLGLPIDIRVTGGTYNQNGGLATFTNNTGGTFNVNGFYTGYTLTISEIISVLGYTPLSAYTDTFVTGGTYSNGIAEFTNNTGGTFDVSGFTTPDSLLGSYLPLSGGSVSGLTTFQSISATTYLGLPIDIRITGGTYNNSAGTALFTNNTGGTFTVNGFYIDFTGGTVSGATNFLNGLTATTISATTYFNLPYWTSGSTGSYSVKTINNTSTDATGNYSVAQGSSTLANGLGSHAEGIQTTASGSSAHSEGFRTTAVANFSHSEGASTSAIGQGSHAEGNGTESFGIASHTEGQNTTTLNNYSHAEGINTVTILKNSHAEGANTTASGDTSHAEGSGTTATGDFSHSQGLKTNSIGQASHAEGYLTIASGIYSHAGGQDTIASGSHSFVHGSGSTASGTGTIVLGDFLSGTSDNTTYVNKFNIKTLPSGSPVNNLGIDSNGDVIVGGASSSNIIKSTTTSAAITGVASVVTLADSVLIPANTFAVGDIIRIRQRGRKTGAGNSTSTIYVNTSNTVTGASLLGTFTTVNSNNLYIQMKRDFYIKSSTVTEGFNATLTSATDDASVASSVTSTNIDWTIDQYLIFAVNPASIANTYVVSGYIIERL